ncbi:MAG: hypothetical protein Aurels2KO_38180 [Aureliella sp.]
MAAPENIHRVACEGRGIAAADGVTAPSMEVLERVREFYDIRLTNARVIPNPISTKTSDGLWCQADASPETILFVGRFDRLKGADVVIAAFNELARQRKQLKLSFCGPDARFTDDSGQHVMFEEYVSRVITDPEIRARVTYFGRQSPEELTEHRRGAAVIVMASRWEAFGYVVLEAMSCGAPFVGTNAGGVPELIQHSKNGLLAEPGDAASLAEQIKCLLDAPELAKRLAAQAAKDARERYSPQFVAQSTLDYYHEVFSRYRKKNGR